MASGSQPSTPLINRIVNDHLSSSQWGIASARWCLECTAVTPAPAALPRFGDLRGWGPDCWEATSQVLWSPASHDELAPLYRVHGTLVYCPVETCSQHQQSDGWQVAGFYRKHHGNTPRRFCPWFNEDQPSATQFRNADRHQIIHCSNVLRHARSAWLATPRFLIGAAKFMQLLQEII